MNASLAALVRRRQIRPEDALACSMLPDELARLLAPPGSATSMPAGR
jgi:hypothetical protein